MISTNYITEWAAEHPWPANEQIEQDLLLSRALVLWLRYIRIPSLKNILLSEVEPRSINSIFRHRSGIRRISTLYRSTPRHSGSFSTI